MALESVYKRNTDVVSRHILDETLLIPIRGNLADMQRIFALNPAAEYIWSELDGVIDLAEVLRRLLDRFQVDPCDAQQDMAEFVVELSAAGLIVEAGH